MILEFYKIHTQTPLIKKIFYIFNETFLAQKNDKFVVELFHEARFIILRRDDMAGRYVEEQCERIT